MTSTAPPPTTPPTTAPAPPPTTPPTTAPAPPPGSQPPGSQPSTSLAPTARQLWTRSRGLLAALLALLVFGLAYAAARSGEHEGRLDPRSADRYGSRAIAQLLHQHGVTVHVATTTTQAVRGAGPGTTLVVADPDLLSRRQLTTLHRAITAGHGRTVLLAPGPDAVHILAPTAIAITPTTVAPRSPGCALPAARRAGTAELGGIGYATTDPRADSCYPVGSYASLLRLPDQAGPGDTVVLGAPDLLYNHRLAKQGNASLALQLLGAHRRVLWYLPSLSDDSVQAPQQRGLFDLVPRGWRWGTGQLALAALVAALWRARRLGPVVPEPLPVAVRAAEATEGRARLYRRGNARARAAEALREATRARLAPRTGVTTAHSPAPPLLVASLAEHTGRDEAEVRSLLYGPDPRDDAALIRLADDLDALEASLNDWQVRRP